MQDQLTGNTSVSDLMDYLVRRDYSEGDFLIRIGDPPIELLFVESGQVTVQLHSATDSPVRLETTGGGRVIGELGFFLHQPRTADVVADTDTVVYVLTQEALSQMKVECPDALHALSQLIISQTSQRVVTMTRALDALRK